MIAVVQRVKRAEVRIDGRNVGSIGRGLVTLLGVARSDTEEDVRWLADKLVGLRVFDDASGKMNRSLRDIDGAMLIVSQFTLLGDCRKGRRPSFTESAPPEQAKTLYESLIDAVGAQGIPLATGRFGAMMEVDLVNDGPVTLIVETPSRRSAS